jgi:transposase
VFRRSEWPATTELVRETLAAVCDRAISMARKHRCGTIVLEKGLGKLRSSGKSRSLNRLLNGWARTVFVQMLTRRARLAGRGIPRPSETSPSMPPTPARRQQR